MILFCYGLTKSGSTLCWQLARGVLQAAGFPQRRLPDDAAVDPRMRINFMHELTEDRLARLRAAVPDDAIVAIKTHSRFRPDLLPVLDEMVAQGALKVHAAYRDPRDICLSLVDAGARSRAEGRKPFAEFDSVELAAERLERQLDPFLGWASVRGALLLPYERTAFRTEDVAREMAQHLGLTVDAARVTARVLRDPAPQKNKVVPNRHAAELTAEQSAAIYGQYRWFIDTVCNSDDTAWIAACRARLLAGEPPRPAPTPAA